MNIIDKINDLEDKGLWKTALLTLALSMEQNPDQTKAYRLLFICWHTLIEWGHLNLNEDAESELFEEHLKKITDTILDKYMNDPEVNFYLGYMFSIVSYYYSQNHDLWEKKSGQMLEFAATSEPNNEIFQMVNLGNKNGHNEQYLKYCKLARPKVSALYSGKGQFNLYFRQVLSR
ncbi:MAG: hypothetical protein OEY19_10365 [Gammaproteobacteria bacterium]|nr:hypothetical protein [Gammaproteobacteria bacterium]